MKNKNLIIGGLVLVGLAGAYYFYNKNKGGGVASSAPASASSPTMGGTYKPNNGVVDDGYRVKTNFNDIFGKQTLHGDCPKGGTCKYFK